MVGAAGQGNLSAERCRGTRLVPSTPTRGRHTPRHCDVGQNRPDGCTGCFIYRSPPPGVGIFIRRARKRKPGAIAMDKVDLALEKCRADHKYSLANLRKLTEKVLQDLSNDTALLTKLITLAAYASCANTINTYRSHRSKLSSRRSQ